jgi:alcohol dehydrogenase class IV
VALGVAGPREPADEAAGRAVDGVEAFLRSVGQRRTLAQLGFTADQEDRIVQDALDDPAIRNSPRLPDRAEAAAILAAVRG